MKTTTILERFIASQWINTNSDKQKQINARTNQTM